MQPAAGIEHLGGRVGVVPVAGEDVRPADEDLAVVGDLHADPGQRHADRPYLVAVRPVHGRGRRGLGEPVALEDGQPGAAEEMTKPVAKRRAAGDRVLHLAANRGPQPGVDEPVEQRVPQPQHRTRPRRAVTGCAVVGAPAGCAPAGRPAPGDGCLHGGAEDPAPGLASACLLLRAVIDLLEYPRHGEQEGGLEP